MRVLSFIPAVFLAVASFVAAAPTGTSSGSVSSCGSSVSGSSSGDDTSLQVTIGVINDAIAQLKPLNDQLASSKDSGSPDPKAISATVVQITAVIKSTTEKLQSGSHADLAGLNLENLGVAVTGILGSTLKILSFSLWYVGDLTVDARSGVIDAFSGLLEATVDLASNLDVFVVYDLAGILHPVFELVAFVLVLLSKLLGLQVHVGFTH